MDAEFLKGELKGHYELLYAIPGRVSEAEIPGVVKRIDDLLASLGASIEKKEELGSQKLAYKIKQEKYGFYVCIVFELNKSKLKELHDKLELDTEVLRFLIVTTQKKTAEDLARQAKIQEKIQSRKKEEVKKVLAHQVAKETEEKPAAAPAPIIEAEVKEKVSMEDLDKKLDEILDQNINL